jgi:hypothetical protein
MEEEKQIDLDILKRVEELSNRVNGVMASMARPLFKRYPLTFMFFILVGAVAVSEGGKGIITDISFFDGHPWRMLLAGIVILIATGTLYKKLKK